MFSLLNRGKEFVDSSNPLTTPQTQTDEMLQNFSREASNVNSLIGMTAASLAFKFVKLGFLAKTSTSLARFVPKLALSGAASALGLMAEVSTFRASNKFLGELSGDKKHQDVFDQKGWMGTAVDFFALKSIGHLASKQSFVLKEFAQANAMVLGHEMSAQFGFTNKEAGTYVERLALAEVMNLQMGAGRAFMGILTGGKISILESEIDFEIKNISSHFEFQITPAFENAPYSQMSSALPRAREEMSREQLILERNNGILHDIGNKVSAPLGHATILEKSAALYLFEKDPFMTQAHDLLNLLKAACEIIYEARRQQAKMRDELGAGEITTEIARIDTDRVRLKISELLDSILVIQRSYHHMGEAYEERPALVGGKNYQKLSPLLENVKVFAREKLKELEEASLPALVPLSFVLQEAWDFSEAERELAEVETVTPDLTSSDILLHINPYSLMSSIHNLLVNSCHAMRGAELRQLRLHGHLMEIDGKKQIVIEVRDTGSGILDDHKEHIFKPKFTTKPRADSVNPEIDRTEPLGTGMGLYMVSEMVRQFGGRIELETEVGKGSTFRIYLNPFDSSLGIEEKISADLPDALNEGSRGRRYSQIELSKEEGEWKKIFGEVVTLDSDEALKDSFTRGKALAKVASTILQQTPYPDCQIALFKVQRMLELAYVRFDFDMLRSYGENVDPEVSRYMDLLIQQANVNVKDDKNYLYTHDEMPLDLPGAYVVPVIDYLRSNLTTQFPKQDSRNVSETVKLFSPESVKKLAYAFVNTFKNRIGALQTSLKIFELMQPGISIQRMLSEDFTDDRSKRTQGTLRRALLDAAEYRRIFLTNVGGYSRHFFSLTFNDPHYNLRNEYGILMDVLERIPEEQREALGIEKLPSEMEIIVNLVKDL